MFFPVRCMFWLTVVYTSISWPGGEGGATSAPAAGLAAAAVTQAATAVRTAAMDACLASPANCATKIAAVSHIVETIAPVPSVRPAKSASNLPVQSTDTLRSDDKIPAPVHTRRLPG